MATVSLFYIEIFSFFSLGIVIGDARVSLTASEKGLLSMPEALPAFLVSSLCFPPVSSPYCHAHEAFFFLSSHDDFWPHFSCTTSRGLFLKLLFFLFFPRLSLFASKLFFHVCSPSLTFSVAHCSPVVILLIGHFFFFSLCRKRLVDSAPPRQGMVSFRR